MSYFAFILSCINCYNLSVLQISSFYFVQFIFFVLFVSSVSMLNKDFQYGIDMVMSVTYSSPFTNSSIIILLYFKYTHTVSIGLLLF